MCLCVCPLYLCHCCFPSCVAKPSHAYCMKNEIYIAKKTEERIYSREEERTCEPLSRRQWREERAVEAEGVTKPSLYNIPTRTASRLCALLRCAARALCAASLFAYTQHILSFCSLRASRLSAAAAVKIRKLHAR